MEQFFALHVLAQHLPSFANNGLYHGLLTSTIQSPLGWDSPSREIAENLWLKSAQSEHQTWELGNLKILEHPRTQFRIGACHTCSLNTCTWFPVGGICTHVLWISQADRHPMVFMSTTGSIYSQLQQSCVPAKSTNFQLAAIPSN